MGWSAKPPDTSRLPPHIAAAVNQPMPWPPAPPMRALICILAEAEPLQPSTRLVLLAGRQHIDHLQ